MIDAALMAVTQHWIPTESSYEKLVAEKLVGEGRAFNKPLFYDQGEDDVSRILSSPTAPAARC